jgi:hypothetical protein
LMRVVARLVTLTVKRPVPESGTAEVTLKRIRRASVPVGSARERGGSGVGVGLAVGPSVGLAVGDGVGIWLAPPLGDGEGAAQPARTASSNGTVVRRRAGGWRERRGALIDGMFVKAWSAPGGRPRLAAAGFGFLGARRRAHGTGPRAGARCRLRAERWS